MADEEESKTGKFEIEKVDKKETTQASADNGDQNGQFSSSPNSSTFHGTQQHYLEAHMVSGVPVTSSTANYVSSHIEEIIEEEEEEDDGLPRSSSVTTHVLPLKTNAAVTTSSTDNAIKSDQSSTEQSIIPYTCATTIQREPHEPPKFVLEAVKEDLVSMPVSTPTPEPPLAISTSTASMKGTKQGAGVKFKVTIAETEQTTSPAVNQDAGRAESEAEPEEVAEIRVEEGYATRQMDEYFRQTIAAIKEELTRKLETQNDPNHDNMAEFDSNDDFNSEDFDEDDEAASVDGDEVAGGQHNESCQCVSCCENGRPTTYRTAHRSDHHHSTSYHRRQQLIYQHLLHSTSGPNGLSRSSSKYTNQIGWLVLLGFFVNQFIIDGLCFSYANIFEHVYKETTASSSKLLASLPNVFLIAFYLLVAPLAIFLTKRYGCRRIALLGSLVSSVSLFVSSFMNNIIAFSVFYGILNGIGISLVYVASLITLSKWFLKKRLFANSLATFGACIGSIVYPLLSDFLLQKYELNGALMILAGIQLNMFVSSLCLRQRRPIFSRLNSSTKARQQSRLKSKSLHNKKSSSSALLIQRDENHENLELATKSTVAANNVNANQHFSTANTTPQMRTQENKPKIPKDRQMMIQRRLGTHRDSETQSTTSTSTEANYTFKQYWRKFVQTRKTHANTKKNLFHLIAEEKRKTRTLSKVSLEDGFVITTSNNLLAPSDEHVIISRQAKLQTPTLGNEPSATSSAKTHTSRFFSRIANSIRSLATGGSTNSPVHATSHSKNHLVVQHTLAPTSNESSVAEGSSVGNRTLKITSEPLQSNATLPIPLMAVFSGPSVNAASNSTEPVKQDNQQTDSHIPPQLASVFHIDLPPPTLTVSPTTDENSENLPDRETTDNENTNQANVIMENCCEESDSDSDEDESRSPNNPNYYTNYQYNYVNKNSTTPSSSNHAYKFSRYLSYRNSLTNSVRGSLMECSVPEDREEGDGMTSGGDGNSTVDYHEGVENEETTLNGGIRRLNPATSSSQRQRYRQKGRFSTIKSSLSPHTNAAAPMNSTISNPNDVRNHVRPNMRPKNCGKQTRMHQIAPLMANARRLISTIDASSLYNLPFNLETVEHNLRNRMIKKNSDKYRTGHSRANSRNQQMASQSNASLFLDYLNYLLNMRLLFNPIVFLVNLSFLLTTTGYCVPLMYMIDFCHLQGIERKQSLYVLCFFGLATGFGRLVSTLAYKANESNEKSRLFTYNLTLFLAALCPLLAPILCDTIFSLIVFGVSFGVLFGFNSTLKPLVLYDLLGLEWCDDSLSSLGLVSQSFGVFIGLPVAGLIRDMYPKEAYTFYLAGSCLMVAFLILSPGRDLRKHLNIAYKNINRYYIQKRTFDRTKPPTF